MDDIDRTFEALKRTDFEAVYRILGTGAITPYVVNPVTFELHVHRIFYPVLERNGWTARDFETKLNNHDE